MHATICDLILDLAQNGVEASSTLVDITVRHDKSILTVTIKDNGKGMSEAVIQRALDPFYTDGVKHRQRRVGLGLPFLKQLTDMTEGSFAIDSTPNQGTCVTFSLNIDHIDLPPMGNIPSLVLSMMNFEGTYDLSFTRVCGSNQYEIRRSELLDAIGGFETSDDLILARTYLRSLDEEFMNNMHEME